MYASLPLKVKLNQLDKATKIQKYQVLNLTMFVNTLETILRNITKVT